MSPTITRWILCGTCTFACAPMLSGTRSAVPRHALSPSSLVRTSPALSFDRFGARILASLVDHGKPDTNVIFSPASAGFTLSLASLGARGATADALATVLGEPKIDRQALVQRGENAAAHLIERSDVQLEIANAIWVDSAARLSSAFAESADRWKATVSTVPLSSNEAVRTINRWADRATHGRIRSILDEPPDPSTRLMLTNAVYFKGKWAVAFDEGATRPRDFTLASGRRIRVPAMERTGVYAYGRRTGFQIVRLPYEGGRAAMYIILPDSGVGVRTLVKRFAASGWPTSPDTSAERDIHLVLPKFHVEQSLNLRPSLEALGGGIAFDCDRADFRDLAVARASGGPLSLCIGRAMQKVYIDVGEQGTEAAAVTGMTVVVTAAPPPPLDFIVDRPFLFVLRDEWSGSDLFVGVIGWPAA